MSSKKRILCLFIALCMLIPIGCMSFGVSKTVNAEELASGPLIKKVTATKYVNIGTTENRLYEIQTLDVTDAMLDEQLSPTSTSKSGDISSKFNTPKETKEEPEETKQEPEEESQDNQDLDAEIRKLLQELQNGISNFPKEEL